MDKLKEIAAKIIADYKEHYDFPWQGESHMEDCIIGNLQSLSQEAVRDEALEEVAQMAQDCAASDHDDFNEFAQIIRALKREPNAAGEPHEYVDATTGAIKEHGPAPAAPDVASMVKRLRNYANESGGAQVEQDLLEAAALLELLGQQVLQARSLR